MSVYDHSCAICKLPIDFAGSDWTTIDVKVQEKVLVPVVLCEDHARRFSEIAVGLVRSAFLARKIG